MSKGTNQIRAAATLRALLSLNDAELFLSAFAWPDGFSGFKPPHSFSDKIG